MRDFLYQRGTGQIHSRGDKQEDGTTDFEDGGENSC
jgi:hypothetical protein